MSSITSSVRQTVGIVQQKAHQSVIVNNQDSPKRSHTACRHGIKSSKSNKEQLGTPSYPSPLDRIHVKRSQLDSNIEELKCKFNDTSHTIGNCSNRDDTGVLNKLKGDGLNSFSYTYACSKGAFPYSSDRIRSLSGSWMFYNYLGGSQHNISCTTCMQNPNKAVVTINNRTTEIMVANKIACRLLGINGNKLKGERLCEYLRFGNGHTMIETQIESSGEIIIVSGKVMEMINSNGENTAVSVWMKKLPSADESRCLVVMEPVERTTAKFYVSSSGKILSCDETMSMLYAYSCPKELEGMNVTQLISSVSLPLQSYDDVSNNIIKQQATGRTRQGTNFPLTVTIRPYHGNIDFLGEIANGEYVFHGTVSVFANISGMITIFHNGTIHSCNTNFSQMLFGLSQEELIGKNITTLIPTFYDDLEFLDTDSIPLPPLDDDDDDDIQLHCLSDGRLTADSITMESRPANPLGKQVELTIENSTEAFQYLTLDSSCSPSPNQKNSNKSSENIEWLQSKLHLWEHNTDSYSEGRSQNNDKSNYVPFQMCKGCTECDSNDNSGNKLLEQLSTNIANYKTLCSNMIDSFEHSHSAKSENVSSNIQTESFSKVSGSPCTLENNFQSTKEKLDPAGITSTPKEKVSHFENNHFSNESLHSFPEGNYFGLGRHKDGCELEISYQIRRIELDDGQVMYCLWVTRDAESGEDYGCRNNVLTSSINSAIELKMEPSHEKCNNEDCSNVDISDSIYTSGDYSHNYTVLQQIGKGAFGCVKMAFRNLDKLLVITKCIQKSKVYPECWAYNSELEKTVPLEISLLISLKHPNIVQVLDIYENEHYFQMVMEKHGSGMDLFEFIDRTPNLDEPLCSYIFRQIVSAISYLHSLNILHRDIKDENIILNQHFHVKLIDFGSATFLQDGHSFSTFCGTMEYCSPEVLQGNKYNGPELEMWALGVTLYTLVFGENPFFDVDETIEAILKPPFQVSQHLMLLISSLLHPDPTQRCSLSFAANHTWTNQPVDLQHYKFDEVIICSSEESNPMKYYGLEKILPKRDANKDYVRPASNLAV